MFLSALLFEKLPDGWEAAAWHSVEWRGVAWLWRGSTPIYIYATRLLCELGRGKAHWRQPDNVTIETKVVPSLDLIRIQRLREMGSGSEGAREQEETIRGERRHSEAASMPEIITMSNEQQLCVCILSSNCVYVYIYTYIYIQSFFFLMHRDWLAMAIASMYRYGCFG